MSKDSKRAIVGVLLLVFFFFLILVGFSIYTLKSFKAFETGLTFDRDEGQIAVVEINGIIMDSKPTIEKLKIAEKDKSIKAIILRVDSPGGAVAPCQEIVEEVRRIDGQKKNPKPIYASLASVAASGGYYVASGTRKIYASPGTLTGSIGVLMQFVDLSKLFSWAKISPNILKAGKYKDIGQPSRAMTPEEKRLIDRMLKKIHKQFVGHILEVRKDKIKGDIWKYAQGQLFTGEEAFEKGLVDELAGLWKAGRNIHEEMKLSGDFNLVFIKKKKKFNFLELLSEFETSLSQLNLGAYLKTMPLFLQN